MNECAYGLEYRAWMHTRSARSSARLDECAYGSQYRAWMHTRSRRGRKSLSQEVRTDTLCASREEADR